MEKLEVARIHLNDSEDLVLFVERKQNQEQGPGPPILLDINQLAERLNLKKSWVYDQTRRRTRGTIPHFRVGKHLRFNEAEVRAWIEKTKRGGEFCPS